MNRAFHPTLLSPHYLWLLLLLPSLAVCYFLLQRRSVRYPVSFSTVEVLRLGMAQAGRMRRHIPALLFSLALVTVVTALARPVVSLPVGTDRSVIVLALDVSGSMRSPDIPPSRLEAAKEAARTFVRSMPDRARVGLVVFSYRAVLMVPPVTDRQRVIDVISSVQSARRRTAIGEGLLEAVASLPERSRPSPDGSLPPRPELPPRGAVVLLSDGRNNAGIDPMRAARLARLQDITVYTVGAGARRPVGTRMTGGALDEETLQAIAAETGGEYYHASSAEDLREIYEKLARSVGRKPQPTEVSALVAGFAAVLLIASLAVSWLAIHPLGV